jgi:predicted metal-binding membrane protein
MTITGKTVLVTGANRGIGRALAEEAPARGAGRVYAGTRQPLAHPGARVTPLTLDVTSAAQIQAAAGQRRPRPERREGRTVKEPRAFRFPAGAGTEGPATTEPRAFPEPNLEAAVAPADPWSGQGDDTDYDYYDTPSGNIWRPGTAPGAVTAQPALTVNAGSGRGLAGEGRWRRGAGGWVRYRPCAAPASPATITGGGAAATAAALAGTLGLAAGCWVVAVWQMRGMDLGAATRPGSLGFFAVWAVMMAAMMLPGAAPAALRRAHAGGGVRAVPLFAGSYLAVWALVGVAVHALDRPHGTVAAGAVVIAAGVYEFTPLKRHFRRRCREYIGSGFGFGLCCLGSSAGLMVMLVALGVMSVTWMAVIAVLVLAQKLLPARAALDVPIAAAITGLGIVSVLAPSSVPGLAPPM